MKSLVRSFLIHLLIFWVTPSVFVGAFNTSSDIASVALAALLFTALHTFVAPLLKLLLLPVSLATFGLASWLVHVILLYLLTVIVPSITISAWDFSGFSTQGFVIPALSLSFFPTLVVISFFMAIAKSILEFLAD